MRTLTSKRTVLTAGGSALLLLSFHASAQPQSATRCADLVRVKIAPTDIGLPSGGEALVDFRPRLNAIRARTLVVWGREDRLIPMSHLDHAHAIPNVRTHTFEDCGHIPQVEMSEAFNNLLLEFLTSP